MKSTPYAAPRAKTTNIDRVGKVLAPTAPAPGLKTTGFGDVAEIRAGLPFAGFLELQAALGLSGTALGDLIGIPARTLQRRREEGRLSKEESDRLDRVRRLHRQAVATLGSQEAARSWLTRPQMALAGFTPLDLADTGAGAREVENLLGRLDYGVYP